MGKDASAIKQEIEQTRERMGDTVEALAYKADVPARLKDNMHDRLDGVKDTIGDVMDNVKTAVVGASDNVKTAVAGASDNLNGAVNSGTQSGAGVISRTRAKVNETMATVNGTINDRLQNAGDRLQDADVAGTAQRAVGVVQENPIGLALTALAIGFLGGSLIPVSDAERRRLTPIGDKIASQAVAATNDLVEAGKAVAMETAQVAISTALSSAKSHGHEVVDAAKTRAGDS